VTTSQPLHPVRSDGSSVDATFELSSISVYEIVFHHKARARTDPRSVNSDYHEGLELILQRLASIGCTVLGVSLDSTVARELDSEERELRLDFPLDVNERTDPQELRLMITRAQRTIARRPNAKPGGGNDQKRIRITLTLKRDSGFDDLKRVLVG
jgi:hypothetical protein